eukprot:CAMPEP_0170541572 /NCGR_PEP_ID=MMETSP0211-20121228/1276_1 /TAXON_ID=311385 /ORGANISM="Pseudokeronopsis sp., Strain OXSARD2" /LENGTH=35 /DNA_ID= /DNA_START= /DNA_END= /DNA_ORIENTATION=
MTSNLEGQILEKQKIVKRNLKNFKKLSFKNLEKNY